MAAGFGEQVVFPVRAKSPLPAKTTERLQPSSGTSRMTCSSRSVFSRYRENRGAAAVICCHGGPDLKAQLDLGEGGTPCSNAAELRAWGRGSLGSLPYGRALGEAVATALVVRDGAPSTGPAPTYAQVQALVDGPGVTCR